MVNASQEEALQDFAVLKRDATSMIGRSLDRADRGLVRRLVRSRRFDSALRKELVTEAAYTAHLGCERCPRAELVRLEDGEMMLQYAHSDGVELDRLFAVLERSSRVLSPIAAVALLAEVFHAADDLAKHPWAPDNPEQVGHGEIEPRSIILGRDGFGRLFETRFACCGFRASASTLGQICRAPELAHKPNARTPAGDGYAIGAVLALAMLGPSTVLPGATTAGRSASPLAINAVRRERDRSLGPELAAVLERALAPSPADRFESAEALRLALRAALAIDFESWRATLEGLAAISEALSSNESLDELPPELFQRYPLLARESVFDPEAAASAVKELQARLAAADLDAVLEQSLSPLPDAALDLPNRIASSPETPALVVSSAQVITLARVRPKQVEAQSLRPLTTPSDASRLGSFADPIRSPFRVDVDVPSTGAAVSAPPPAMPSLPIEPPVEADTQLPAVELAAETPVPEAATAERAIEPEPAAEPAPEVEAAAEAPAAPPEPVVERAAPPPVVLPPPPDPVVLAAHQAAAREARARRGLGGAVALLGFASAAAVVGLVVMREVPGPRTTIAAPTLLEREPREAAPPKEVEVQVEAVRIVAPQPAPDPAPDLAPDPEPVQAAEPPPPAPGPEAQPVVRRPRAPRPEPAAEARAEPATIALPDIPAIDVPAIAPPQEKADAPPSAALPALEGGRLVINVLPWGNVFVDDRAAGYPPVVLEGLAPGKHVIRVKRDGYRTIEHTIELEDGEDERVHLVLEREAAP